MAIIITDKFQLRQKNFLDDRQGIASSVSALKSWNYSTVPIPEGFEVYVGGVWYTYRSSNPDDPVTGRFKTRTDDEGVDDLKVRVIRLEFEDGRDVASTFAEIKTEAFWTDSTGVSHARAGRIVTVTSDGANNGPWYLISSDYTKTENWIKLIGRGDLVTTTGGASISDTSVYTSAKIDATFPKKVSPENITAEWIFKEDQVFEKDLTTDTLHATTGTITNLNSTNGNITDLTSETANINKGTVTTLTSSSGTITNLGSTTGNISNLTSETANINKGTVTTLTSSSGTITNLGSTTGNISNLTSGTTNITNGTITNLNSTNSTATNQTVTGKLQTTGQAVLKEVNVGTHGSIKDESGETVARVDRIVANHSELADLDQQIRDRTGLIGVGNLLKNTSFAGQYESLDLDNDSDIGASTSVYNSKYADWNVSDAVIVDDSDSITSHSMYLPRTTSIISQETVMVMNTGTSYILSWKQKGNVKVEFGNYDLDIQTVTIASRYKYCYAQITPTTTRKEIAVFSGGSGYIFEIKLEEGVIPTTWFPSVLDTDPIADELYKFEYLRASFLDQPEGTDLTISNVYLKNQIKLGDIINNQVTDVYGGISGIVSGEDDVMIWSGGSYEKAVELLAHIANNESYLDTLTPAQLKTLTKSIISFNYKSIFTDIYAVGKFRGKYLDENGGELSTYPKLTGYLPAVNGSITTKVGFTGGRLNKVNGSYPTSIDFGGTIINFNAGLCTTPEGQFTIDIGSNISGVTSLHLVFHEGFLTKINSVKDYNSTYYWY